MEELNELVIFDYRINNYNFKFFSTSQSYISNGGKFGKLEYGNIAVLTVLILWVIWVTINNLI